MKVCIEGLLRNASRGYKINPMVKEFIGHLKELKEDPALHKEFFDLYVFSQKKEQLPVTNQIALKL